MFENENQTGVDQKFFGAHIHMEVKFMKTYKLFLFIFIYFLLASRYEI
jgi:hypothetical protein